MRCRKGTTSLEFAIIGSLFFMMLIGTIEVARLYFTQQSLREITAAAARQAMIDSSLSGCTRPATAVAAMTPVLRPALLNLCVTRTTSAGLTTLTINATYPVSTVISVLRLGGRQMTDQMTVTFNAD